MTSKNEVRLHAAAILVAVLVVLLGAVGLIWGSKVIISAVVVLSIGIVGSAGILLFAGAVYGIATLIHAIALGRWP